MAEKEIKSRIQQKHDIEENWLKATNFIPKQGEIIIYDKDSNHNYIRIKIGDGETVVNSLPFFQDVMLAPLTAKAGQTIVVKEVDDSGKPTKWETVDLQSDWNQNDETQPDYVKNRTHWVDGGLVELLPETPIVPDGETHIPEFVIEDGKTYIVNIGGLEYTCVGQDLSGIVGTQAGGLGNLMEMGMPDTGEPFMIAYAPAVMSGMNLLSIVKILDGAEFEVVDGLPTVKLSVYEDAKTIHKLDNKFIDAEWMATTKEVKGELIVNNNSNLSEYPDKKLEKGKKYTVTWDGVDYDCVGLDSGSVWNGCVYLGNLAPLGGAGNGEPFLIIEVEGDFEGNHTLMVGLAEGLGSADGHTFAIFTPSVKVPVKLPAKFLPEGVPYSEGEGLVEILPETEGVLTEGGEVVTLAGDLSGLVVGETYTVKYNGVAYETVAVEMVEEGMTAIVLGNIGGMGGDEGSGEPFVIITIPPEMAEMLGGAGAMVYPLDGALPVIVGIYKKGEVIHKLDNKYIDAEWMATYEKEFQTIGEDDVGVGISGTIDMPPLVVGETYKVIWQGEEYTCIAQNAGEVFTGINRVALGDATEYGGTSNGEPFCFWTFSIYGEVHLNTKVYSGPTSGRLIIKGLVDTPVKLPEKFMPDTVASKSDLDSKANSEHTHDWSDIFDKPRIATEDDAMELLIDLGCVSPVAISDGTIMTNSNGKIYSF